MGCQILIVDATTRGEALGDLFSGIAGCTAFRLPGPASLLKGPYWDPVNSGPTFDLALVHHTDRDLWNGAKLQSAHVLYFTGGSGFLAQPTWIQRSLGADSITPHEARELLEWFARGQTGAVPVLLTTDETAADLLSALAILCQAYFAVIAQSQGAKDQDVEDALIKMGWDSRADGHLVQRDTDVRSPHWWRASLRIDDVAADRQWLLGESVSRDESIRNLLRAIADGSQIWPPRLVAKAYDSLRDALAI